MDGSVSRARVSFSRIDLLSEVHRAWRIDGSNCRHGSLYGRL